MGLVVINQKKVVMAHKLVRLAVTVIAVFIFDNIFTIGEGETTCPVDENSNH